MIEKDRLNQLPAVMNRKQIIWWISVAALLTVGIPLAAAPITLTGANGRKVEFVGIKEATSKGILAQVVEEGDLIGVRWEKLDLEALKKENALIYAAFEASKGGETIAVDLGSFAKPGTEHVTGQPNTPVAAEAPKGRWPGWLDTDVRGVKFLFQLPMGKPRGILLLAQGDQGDAFRYVMGHQKGSGPWGDFQNRYQLALLTYEYRVDERTKDVQKADEFIFAEKHSGESLVQALNKFSVDAKAPGLAELPIAIYGMGRVGAAFGYNFMHWKPDSILGAVLVKGAFYEAAPSDVSAKIPAVFIWGQYSNDAELWNSDRIATAVLAEANPLVPNWTDAREFRGGGEMNAVVDDFSRKALETIIELRLPETPEPPPKPDKGDDDGEAAEPRPEEPAAPEPPDPKPIDRSAGYTGNLAEGTFKKIDDPAAPLAEGETFLLTRELAEKWRDFVNGEYQPPPPPPAE